MVLRVGRCAAEGVGMHDAAMTTLPYVAHIGYGLHSRRDSMTAAIRIRGNH